MTEMQKIIEKTVTGGRGYLSMGDILSPQLRDTQDGLDSELYFMGRRDKESTDFFHQRFSTGQRVGWGISLPFMVVGDVDYICDSFAYGHDNILNFGVHTTISHQLLDASGGVDVPTDCYSDRFVKEPLIINEGYKFSSPLIKISPKLPSPLYKDNEHIKVLNEVKK